MKKITYTLLLFATMFFLSGCEKSDEVVNMELLSTSVENIKANSATVNVTHNFAKPDLISKGVWCSTYSSTIISPQSEDFIISTASNDNFSVNLTTLSASTTYFLRPFAIYATDTVFGEEIEFTTDDYLLFNPSVQYASVTDIDGNEYKTVKIGDQVWMAENLRVTRYRNGESIMTFETRTDLQSPTLYWYNNNKDNKEVYGAYYNWMAVSDKRNIAPEGWRVATLADWEELFKHIGYNSGQLMETTSAHWNFENTLGLVINTNATGFTAVSSGVAHHPTYQGRNHSWASFWTSETFQSDESYKVFLSNDKPIITFAADNIFNGYPIRCIKE